VRRLLLTAALGLVAALSTAVPGASAHTLSGVAADVPTGGHGIRSASRAHTASLDYYNGPVLHSNRTHLIFWQPSGSGLSFDPGYEALIATFMSQVAADSHRPTNVYSLTGQYHDAGGPAAYDSRYGGAIVDSDPLPPNGCVEPVGAGPGWTTCLSSDQIDNEVHAFIAAHHLPTAAGDLYMLLTPRGLGSCEMGGPTNCALGGSTLSGYCGYHTNTPDATIKYAVIPYNAVSGHCQSDNPRPNGSTADPSISTISHEHNEIITDPFGNAWVAPSGEENGDLCISEFGSALGGAGSSVYNQVIHGGHYYLQQEWSNDDGACASHDEADRVSTKGPRRIRVHHKAKFLAGASDPDGAIVAYFWTFGDGRSARGKSVHHRYKKRGTYTVTLRVSDSGGNWAFATRKLRVR